MRDRIAQDGEYARRRDHRTVPATLLTTVEMSLQLGEGGAITGEVRPVMDR
jgi:hypothetical protein